MIDCLELIGDIVAVIPVEVGTVSFSIPMNAMCESYSKDDVKISGEPISADDLKSLRGFAMLNYYNTVPEGGIIIEPGSTAKESSKTTSSGTYYTTKISSKSYEGVENIRKFVNDMNGVSAFDLFVVDLMDRVFVIRGSEPACSISLSAYLPISGTQSVDFEMVSVNGLIPIIFE